jgi:hypothetical protein
MIDEVTGLITSFMMGAATLLLLLPVILTLIVLISEITKDDKRD